MPEGESPIMEGTSEVGASKSVYKLPESFTDYAYAYAKKDIKDPRGKQ